MKFTSHDLRTKCKHVLNISIEHLILIMLGSAIEETSSKPTGEN